MTAPLSRTASAWSETSLVTGSEPHREHPLFPGSYSTSRPDQKPLLTQSCGSTAQHSTAQLCHGKRRIYTTLHYIARTVSRPATGHCSADNSDVVSVSFVAELRCSCVWRCNHDTFGIASCAPKPSTSRRNTEVDSSKLRPCQLNAEMM
jgi:hypothetical protein